jgi:hypothetical protein
MDIVMYAGSGVKGSRQGKREDTDVRQCLAQLRRLDSWNNHDLVLQRPKEW